MSRCWIYRSALRRHLDDGQPLADDANTHARNCVHCRATLDSHRALIQKLQPPPAAEAPFLHARIMNSIHGAERPAPRWNPAWMLAAVALVVAAGLIYRTPSHPKANVVTLTLPSFTLPTSAKLPIETELENLKADTRHAAHALAASFLPDKP